MNKIGSWGFSMDIPYAEIANLVRQSLSNETAEIKNIQTVKNWLIKRGHFSEESEPLLKQITWKNFTADLVSTYCAEINSPNFTLQDLQQSKKHEIENFRKSNKHPFDKIRQQLQFLREDGLISFVDNKGTYALTEFR